MIKYKLMTIINMLSIKKIESTNVSVQLTIRYYQNNLNIIFISFENKLKQYFSPWI